MPSPPISSILALGRQPRPIRFPARSTGSVCPMSSEALGSVRKSCERRVASEVPTAYFDFRLGTPWACLLDQIDLRGSKGSADEQALIAGALKTFAVYAGLARPLDAAA